MSANLRALPAPSRPADLIGTSIRGYRVTELIGVGGVGAVYRGVHAVIATEVAIKVVHAEVAKSRHVIERFDQEAKLPGTIGSASVPRCFELGRLPDGRPFAIMELVRGETLDRYLARTGPLAIGDALELLREIALVLAEVHAAGVVHRDIKPANIVLVKDRQGRRSLKVIDFGIAKVIANGPVRRITRGGIFVGTLSYAAPEQLAFDDVATGIDLYALGVIAYEMLTGELPFDGDNKTVWNAKQQLDAPRVGALRSDVPRELDDLVARMLSRRPSERPATMTEAHALMGALGDELTVWSSSSRHESFIRPTAPDLGIANKLVRMIRSGPGLIAALLVAAFAGATFALLF